MKELLVTILIFYNILNLKCLMIIKNYRLCESEYEYDLLMYFTPYMEGNRQYMDGNSTLKIPLSDELKMRIQVDMVVGKRYIQVLNFYENQACKTLHRYLGEYFYDIERAAGITPRLCPIRQGKYRVQHALVDSSKISIQAFPVGLLRFNVSIFDKANDIKYCGLAEVANG